MAPEHLTVTTAMLSDYAESFLDPDRPWKPSKKLVPNLLNMTKYVAHYRNLQLYTKHGLMITKFTGFCHLHRGHGSSCGSISVTNNGRQHVWLEFESDLAKVQAIFGRTMEQVRIRVDVRLIADPNKLLKAVAKGSFRESEIINQDLVMVRGAPNKITLNKPIALGFSILEISKFIMYSFYYDHLIAKYADRCTLLFTDTHSLCCEIRTDDLYADMMDSLDLYDTSNFDPTLPQYRRKPP